LIHNKESDVTENTDGTPAADNAGTDAAPAQTPTTPTSDNVGRSAEDRIAGLVAERERWKRAAEKNEADKVALEEKYKTDEDKRFDERVASEVTPIQQRLEHFEADYVVRRDKLLETLPEESRNCYDDKAPVETQLRQVEIVAEHLSKATPAASVVDSGGNPGGTTPTGNYSIQDYNRISALATTDKEAFEREWPALESALLAGKVAGIDAQRKR
jgi:hypothetical protein